MKAAVSGWRVQRRARVQQEVLLHYQDQEKRHKQ